MGSRAVASLHEEVAADARAPACARRFLERHLSDLPMHLLDRLKLLVTELVTNAVTHGQGSQPIDIFVITSPTRVRVDVTNEGPGFEQRPRPPTLRSSGWGLFLVEELSDRWGVIGRDCTRVWFEVERRGESKRTA